MVEIALADLRRQARDLGYRLVPYDRIKRIVAGVSLDAGLDEAMAHAMACAEIGRNLALKLFEFDKVLISHPHDSWSGNEYRVALDVIVPVAAPT